MDAGVALTRHALQEAFSGRRRYGLVLLALAPVALALALRRWGQDPGASDAAFVVFVVGVGLVVPLLALWIGVATLREELVSGTIVHLVTRPVSRASILGTRLVGACLATWLVAGIGLSLVFPALGYFDAEMFGILWGVAGLASLAYTSLFALLGAATDRGILAGLLYLLGWEGFIASSDLVFRKATVAYWVRSIVDAQNLAGGGLLAGEVVDPASTSVSLLVLVGIGLAAAVAGMVWFSRREFTGSEPA